MIAAARVVSVVCGLLGTAACGTESASPLQTAVPGVVFTYPIDQQLDVPLGSRIVVTFSDPVVPGALGCADAATGGFCLVGPAGPIAATAEITGDGRTVQFATAELAPGTLYAVHVGAALSPTAKNLPASGPLFSFTTRSTRPRAAPPAVLAVNGAASGSGFRPLFETSTIRVVFSEPLDPRTVELAPGSVELVDAVSRAAVPATVIAHGIHLAIDPLNDLTAGASYEVRLGGRLADLGGQPLAPVAFTLVPEDSLGVGSIPQVLRTRQPGDPGPTTSRAGADRNVIVIDKPLIGREASVLEPAALAAELGDPKALGGPIAFTIRRGQRLSATGLDVKLGGDIPVGLATGAIQIEFLTDGGGRIYRNPYQDPTQRPENARAPLFVDLSIDVAVYAIDPTGNAVLTQTVLGVQATGTVIATDGVLAIETVASMELGLLGVTEAPTNLVLELITDPSASVPADDTAPELVAMAPAEDGEHPVGAGIQIIFSEPIDLDRARAGGIRLDDAAGREIPSIIESHGAAIAIRPLDALLYAANYRVVFADVSDVAGNPMADTLPVDFATSRVTATGVPMTVVAVYPGAPCALTGDGRCAGGQASDAVYGAFSIAANESVEVAFSEPLRASSATLGTACGAGSVRVEELDAAGACLAAVPGTLIVRDRSLGFIADQPWVVGRRYRLALISGGNNACDGGELCSAFDDAASFDPLAGSGSGDGGGPNLVVTFTGAAATTTTFMVAEAGPYADLNGSGFVDGGEVPRDANRAALRITGTTGAVGSASFDAPDCVPGTPTLEACMYLSGAMPVAMGELSTSCPLPGGGSAPSCIPVTLSPQAMYATSITMDASVGITISTDTGATVMRIREPATGPLLGYIIDKGGAPTLVVALELYMDAPDMSIPLSDHDLHSKSLALTLEGPVTFLADGRIAIRLQNTEDVPVAVAIDAPLGLTGSVQMVLPRGEMKLQLVSRPLRGGEL